MPLNKTEKDTGHVKFDLQKYLTAKALKEATNEATNLIVDTIKEE